ncbi:hypothetical protein HPB47_018737, partial [Ixodes persulcatus]
VCPSNENGKDDHVRLICKCCRTTIKSDQGRAAVRLAEHVKSARDVKLKAAHSETGCSSTQPSLHSSMTRAVDKRKEGNDIAHEFCRALCQAAIPLHLTDGPLGDLFRRRCPAARTMPTSSQMYKKYLPDVYQSDVAAIRDAIRDSPIA